MSQHVSAKTNKKDIQTHFKIVIEDLVMLTKFINKISPTSVHGLKMYGKNKSLSKNHESVISTYNHICIILRTCTPGEREGTDGIS